MGNYFGGVLPLGSSGYEISRLPDGRCVHFSSRREALEFIDDKLEPSDARQLMRLGWGRSCARGSEDSVHEALADALFRGELWVVARSSADAFVGGVAVQGSEPRFETVPEGEPLVENPPPAQLSGHGTAEVDWVPLIVWCETETDDHVPRELR